MEFLLLKMHIYRVAVIGKKFEGETDKKEKWYGTDYKIEPIPQATMEVNPKHPCLLNSNQCIIRLQSLFLF